MKIFAADLEDADNLAKFFGTMKHFNSSYPMNTKLQKDIVALFEYRWKNDKLIAF